jgi:ribosomal protein L11 methyltransferase
MNTPFTIEAGAAAFGDGNHPTTRMVLVALEAMDGPHFTPRMACDMGAGSGILALAVHGQCRCPVVAVEMAREALPILRRNIAANGAEGRIIAIHADGFAHTDVAAHAPFDLITMNILATPLLKLAVSAEAALAPGGALIISGALQWQEPQLREAYAGIGLELTARMVLADWVCHVWQKPE